MATQLYEFRYQCDGPEYREGVFKVHATSQSQANEKAQAWIDDYRPGATLGECIGIWAITT